MRIRTMIRNDGAKCHIDNRGNRKIVAYLPEVYGGKEFSGHDAYNRAVQFAQSKGYSFGENAVAFNRV